MLAAIVAHPDDAELGCGGWLAKDGGVIITVTNGANHTRDEQTAFEEQTRAAKMLGVKAFVLPFAEPVCTQDVVGAIDNILSAEGVTAVITHGEDSNQEHSRTREIALAAARRINRVLLLEPVPPSRPMGFVPQLYVDISEEATQKYRALAMHKSQIIRAGDRNLIKTRRSLDSWRGAELGVSSAEAFQVVRWEL